MQLSKLVVLMIAVSSFGNTILVLRLPLMEMVSGPKLMDTQAGIWLFMPQKVFVDLVAAVASGPADRLFLTCCRALFLRAWRADFLSERIQVISSEHTRVRVLEVNI